MSWSCGFMRHGLKILALIVSWGLCWTPAYQEFTKNTPAPKEMLWDPQLKQDNIQLCHATWNTGTNSQPLLYRQTSAETPCGRNTVGIWHRKGRCWWLLQGKGRATLENTKMGYCLWNGSHLGISGCSAQFTPMLSTSFVFKESVWTTVPG